MEKSKRYYALEIASLLVQIVVLIASGYHAYKGDYSQATYELILSFLPPTWPKHFAPKDVQG